MKYIASIMSNESAEWYEVEAASAAEAVALVREQVFGGDPLGAGTTIEAALMPDKPVHVTRLADMTEFEAEWVEKQTPVPPRNVTAQNPEPGWNAGWKGDSSQTG
jgi:hypothetical protein